MPLNLLGSEAKQPAAAPVTLPRVSLPESDDQTIAEEWLPSLPSAASFVPVSMRGV